MRAVGLIMGREELIKKARKRKSAEMLCFCDVLLPGHARDP
jgi:hypothetical protein